MSDDFDEIHSKALKATYCKHGTWPHECPTCLNTAKKSKDTEISRLRRQVAMALSDLQVIADIGDKNAANIAEISIKRIEEA